MKSIFLLYYICRKGTVRDFLKTNFIFNAKETCQKWKLQGRCAHKQCYLDPEAEHCYSWHRTLQTLIRRQVSCLMSHNIERPVLWFFASSKIKLCGLGMGKGKWCPSRDPTWNQWTAGEVKLKDKYICHF